MSPFGKQHHWAAITDASGLRTSKAVGGVTTQYYWLGDKLQAQSTGNDYLIFLYDEAGVPYGLIHKYGSTETKYYYEYNLQGDIIGIISDIGTRVVTYQYSAWGELLSTSGSMASNIGASNPLRYRGYYYDSETGLYYLQSRYYDPVTGRFINADNYSSTGQGVLGNNMFAYCRNNPVSRKDASGTADVSCYMGDDTPWDDLVSDRLSGGGGGSYAFAYNPIDAGYRYGVDLSIAARSSFTHGGIYNNGYVAYSTHTNPAGTSSASSASAHNGVCFVAGTLVYSEVGNVPIESILAGDLVWAWNEENGEVALKEIVETYVNETDELIHVFVNGEEIVTTPSHPFYSPVKGWTDAVHLRAGDILVTVNGEYVVVEKIQHEILENPVFVYNFHVEEYHTYFVSDAKALVHNSCYNPPVFDKNQQAVLELANEYKNGVTAQEAMILIEWANEYGISNHLPMTHPGRGGYWSNKLHIGIRKMHISVYE